LVIIMRALRSNPSHHSSLDFENTP
jgi:hypothetical protein